LHQLKTPLPLAAIARINARMDTGHILVSLPTPQAARLIGLLLLSRF
jgi:hypothetical protein